jgi:predicted metalloprotease with PDZ domain
LRRFISERNRAGELQLEFHHEMKADSDHYPFFARNIPVVMLHTGKHEDYHRPSDDVDKLDFDGMQAAARLMFEIAFEAASRDELAGFRVAAINEASTGTADYLASIGPEKSPAPRLGVTWNQKLAQQQNIYELASVSPESPASRGGLQVGDRIVEFGGYKVDREHDLRLLVLIAKNPVAAFVRRGGEERPIELSLELAGQPVRVGIEWRLDDAEPGCLILTRVVAGSPANRAGLREGDRIYEVAGHACGRHTEELRRLMTTLESPLTFLVERNGQLRNVEVKLLDGQAVKRK